MSILISRSSFCETFVELATNLCIWTSHINDLYEFSGTT